MNERALCDQCEYPDLCLVRKHFYKMEAPSIDEYLGEPRFVLVSKYIELKEKVSEIEEEMGKVREAILDYAKSKQVEVIKGSSGQARVTFDKKLKFLKKNENERQELDSTIIEAGKRMEVSKLDMASLIRFIEDGL